MEQHHLVPKTLLLHGPLTLRRLVDEGPAITLTTQEHQQTLHSTDLNPYLKARGVDLCDVKSLSRSQLLRVVALVEEYYKSAGAPALCGSCARVSGGAGLTPCAIIRLARAGVAPRCRSDEESPSK